MDDANDQLTMGHAIGGLIRRYAMTLITVAACGRGPATVCPQRVVDDGQNAPKARCEITKEIGDGNR